MSDLQNGQPVRIRRIIVIDDNDATHQDFRKILACRACVLDDMEAALFGDERSAEEPDAFEIDSALQGQQGLEMVQRAMIEGRPYELAFVDLRMPPGLDGFETITKIWEVDPQLQIVLCAAYLGCTRDEVIARLGRSDGLDILGKPFEPANVLQLAHRMTENCHLLRQTELAPA
jgi:CheY-like chemotaxis protein